MRALCLLLMFCCAGFAAEPVNWTVFPKVRTWDFETVPQNHANIDASVIIAWITPEVPMRSVDRAKQAAKFIIAYTKSFYLRAVLMRDALDAISKLDRNFQALDRLADNGVLFIGRAIDTDSRYALGISFNDGKFYRGPYLCSFDAAKDYQVNFWDHTQWTLVE